MQRDPTQIAGTELVDDLADDDDLVDVARVLDVIVTKELVTVVLVPTKV